MLADAHSSHNKRIAGRLSVRSSLIAVAVCLGLLWVTILFGTLSDNRRNPTAWEKTQSWLLWETTPVSITYRLDDGGLACKAEREPDWQLWYSQEELHGAELWYYRIAVAEWNYRFTESDTESIGVCFYPNKREAYFAASELSPSGSRFYSRTGLFTRRVVEAQPDSSRKVWLYKNALIFYEGEDAEVAAALTAFLGEPAADGQRTDPAETKQTFTETVRLFLYWKWWPTILILTALGAGIALCLYFAFYPPGRKNLKPDAFVQLMKGKGVTLLAAGQVTADPYGGFPGVKAVRNFLPDNAASLRMLAKLPFKAADGNVEAIDRLGLVSVLFFKNEKTVAAAMEQLSPMGDRLEKKDGRIIRLGFSVDRMILPYKNTLVYYNGRDEILRSALNDLRQGK